MNKNFLFCGSICALIGAIGIVFAVGAGEWFVLTIARASIEGIAAPSFDSMLKGVESCSAYKGEFKYPFDKSKRKWKKSNFEDDDNEPKCQSSSRTHYYLYHLNNEADVLSSGAIPEVERRGPWVFKSESRTYTFEKSGDTVSETSRSWRMIDDKKTKELCPDCATDKLCASWDYSGASKTAWPTTCTKGTNAGDATYNAITHPNPGYLGLLNLIARLGADEKFLVYLFGSVSLTTLMGPGLYANGTTANDFMTPAQFRGNCSNSSFSLTNKFSGVGMIYPLELGCFLLRSEADIGSPGSAIIPRPLTQVDLNGWDDTKTNRFKWLLQGANMSDGSKPIETAPKLANLPAGWAGIRWAAISAAYDGMIGKGIPESIFVGYTATNNISCAAPFETALKGVGDNQALHAFNNTLGRGISCKELQTMKSYTYYVAEKYAIDATVKQPSCNAARLAANDKCFDKCKAYTGCKDTPSATNVPKKFGWLNCSDASSDCTNFKPCYFNKLGWKSYGYANFLANTLADKAPGDKGGMFITLESQSIFTGWTDAVIVNLEDALGIDAGTSSRTSGILGDSNLPYQADGVTHDDACWEKSAFVDVLKEEGSQNLDANEEPQDCGAPDDPSRRGWYLTSPMQAEDKYKKPCHYKKKDYYSSSYAFKSSNEKMLQVASVGGNSKVKGLKERTNPFGVIMDATKNTWGEEVAVEGFTTGIVPPVLVKANKAKKTYYEIQDIAKSEDDVKKMIDDANKETKDLFPEEFKIWTGPLQRTTTVKFSKMSKIKGDDSSVVTRTFAPDGFTRFTKEASSSDREGGYALNPTCLVNLKKRDDVDIYVGNKDFHGCSADPQSMFDKFDIASVTKTLYKAKVVDANGATITSTDKDKLSLDIEPVTGKAMKGNIATGVYIKVQDTPVYSKNVKPTIVPYFSTVIELGATKMQIDTLSASLNQIPYMINLLGSILYTVGCAFFIFGVAMIVLAFCGKKGEGADTDKDIQWTKNTELRKI